MISTTKGEEMTKDEVIKKLKGFIYSEYGTAKNYADHNGVSSAFVSAVLTGIRAPSKYMLDDISVIKEVKTTYKQLNNKVDL